MKALPFTNQLSPELHEAIGRVIFAGALLETAIAAILINALGLNRKEGRALIWAQSAAENLEILVTIARNRGLTGVELKRLSKLVSDIGKHALKHRNMFAHGSWQIDSDGVVGVTSFRGGTDRSRSLIGERTLIRATTINLFVQSIESWHWELLKWVEAHEDVLFQWLCKQPAPVPHQIPRPNCARPERPLRLRSLPK